MRLKELESEPEIYTKWRRTRYIFPSMKIGGELGREETAFFGRRFYPLLKYKNIHKRKERENSLDFQYSK